MSKITSLFKHGIIESPKYHGQKPVTTVSESCQFRSLCIRCKFLCPVARSISFIVSVLAWVMCDARVCVS